jgi:hypothetical protein
MSTSSDPKVMKFFQHEPYRLGEWKDEYIEQWTREMLKHPVIGPLNLTARQRRVIASLIWWKKVNESNKDSAAQPDLQPPPLVGLDARNRPVVQKIEGKGPHSHRMWALTKEGEPADLKEPVISLKTGKRVIDIPPYARSEERW